MDILSIITFIISIIFSVIWWILSFFFLPLFILLVIALLVIRFAYRFDYLKPFIDRQFKKLGQYGLNSAKGIAYALTVLPLHVLFRFLWLSVWHAFISLLWKPKWSPWERARKIPRKTHKET